MITVPSSLISEVAYSRVTSTRNPRLFASQEDYLLECRANEGVQTTRVAVVALKQVSRQWREEIMRIIGQSVREF
jgi:hypothetical protein